MPPNIKGPPPYLLLSWGSFSFTPFLSTSLSKSLGSILLSDPLLLFKNHHTPHLTTLLLFIESNSHILSTTHQGQDGSHQEEDDDAEAG